jgi:hypothetical protein
MAADGELAEKSALAITIGDEPVIGAAHVRFEAIKRRVAN